MGEFIVPFIHVGKTWIQVSRIVGMALSNDSTLKVYTDDNTNETFTFSGERAVEFVGQFNKVAADGFIKVYESKTKGY